MYVWIDLHVLIMNNFEHGVLHIGRINTAVQICAINSRSTVLNLHRDKKTQARTGERCEYP